MPGEEFRDIVAFIRVAEARSFTRAAAQLGVSQSALSHAIQGLEARLGLRLLTRTTRSVSPTEAGERLLEHVAPRFDAIAAELASLRELSSKIAGTVRITTSDFACNVFVWPRLSQTLLSYPDIRLEISWDSALTDIVSERFDAGIRPGDRVGNMASVRISPDLPVSIVAAPAYLQGKVPPLTPDDLAQHACINTRFSMQGGINAWPLQQGEKRLALRVEGPLIFNSVYPALDAALAGYGLACLPDLLVQPHLDAGRLQKVLAGYGASLPGFHLCYPGERQLLPALSLIAETLRYPAAS